MTPIILKPNETVEKLQNLQILSVCVKNKLSRTNIYIMEQGVSDS